MVLIAYYEHFGRSIHRRQKCNNMFGAEWFPFGCIREHGKSVALLSAAIHLFTSALYVLRVRKSNGFRSTRSLFFKHPPFMARIQHHLSVSYMGQYIYNKQKNCWLQLLAIDRLQKDNLWHSLRGLCVCVYCAVYTEFATIEADAWIRTNAYIVLYIIKLPLWYTL